MVRLGNRHGNFTNRNVKRCDTRIKPSLRDNMTGTPNHMTNDGGGEHADEYKNGQIFWMSKFNGRIDEGKNTQKVQSQDNSVKACGVSGERRPQKATQQKQRSPEKRGRA